ncbi:Major facilitator super domain-containing protein 7 [Podochytrium sp. JEL0797]|nr:Major facilitator super domain-containing protein 7 [Podochytrium sp. JEL0797]
MLPEHESAVAVHPDFLTSPISATPSTTPAMSLDRPEVRLTSFRFLVAIGVFFANFNSALMWASYASISSSAAEFYECSAWTVNLLALIFQITFIPLAFPSMFVLDSYGLRISVLVGAWGATIGACVRWIGPWLCPEPARVPLLFLGQLIAAIATPFAFNAPTKVCASWFGDKERLTANTFMSLAMFGGTALAMAIAPSIVGDTPSNITKLNFAVFIICFVTGLTSLFVYDKPTFAPSLSAQEVSLPFKEGMKKLMTNRDYWVIVAVYGMSAGGLDTYFTLISDYITPYGYSEADSGLLGIVTIAVGCISSLLIGLLLDYTKQHRLGFKLVTFLTFLGALLFYFSARFSDQKPLLFFSACVIGLGGFTLAPIALELGVECTHPVSEGSSAGVLQTSGQLFGVIVLVVSNALRAEDGTLADAMLWRIGLAATTVCIVPFYNAASRRMALEGVQEK